MKQENNSAKSAKYVYTIFWCSIVITVIDVGVVAIMCYKGGCFGIHSINFGDASVAALGAITAVLLGWNIYSVIDMKNLKEETERRVDDMFQEKAEEYAIEIREQIIDVQITENINNAIYYFQSFQHDEFLRTMSNTLHLLHYIDNEEKVKYCVDRINQYFDKRIGIEYNKIVLDSLKEQLYYFVSNGDYVRELIDRISEQKVIK